MSKEAPAAKAFDVILEQVAQHKDGALFALLDGARDEAILPALKRSKHKASCLFSGELPPELEAVAPWLVDLQTGNNAFTDWLLTNGWGESWGVFLVSKEKLGKLAKHFRRFLQVERGGKKLYFRYYDPRVLRVYLPTCLPEEVEFVFGPVDAFLMEGPRPTSLLEFHRDGEVLKHQDVDLAAAAAGAAPAAASGEGAGR